MSHVFSAQASYIQVGAMIGTWTVPNVTVRHNPRQRELVAAKVAGREPDATPHKP